MQKLIIYINERNHRDIDYIINLIRFLLLRNYEENFL